ncbi:putative lrr receptor-like serine/threonine-protein kinase, partial [Quercus suber]
NYFQQPLITLEGNIPKSIGRLKSVSFFVVGSNMLNSMVPSSLYNLSYMSILGFEFNQLSGALPANIGLTLPNLKLFEISGNKFFGPIPGSLCNASKLQIIELAYNNLVGSVSTNLGYLLDLEVLNLGHNKLGRDLDFLMSLRNCSKLEVLIIAINQFEGVLPNFIGNLSTQLNALYLEGNQIFGTIPIAMQNLVNLILLHLDENLFTVEEANNIEDSRHIDVDMQKCLLSILNIGILCSLESPKDRMSMEEVIRELQSIKSAFISLGMHRGRPSRAQ